MCFAFVNTDQINVHGICYLCAGTLLSVCSPVQMKTWRGSQISPVECNLSGSKVHWVTYLLPVPCFYCSQICKLPTYSSLTSPLTSPSSANDSASFPPLHLPHIFYTFLLPRHIHNTVKYLPFHFCLGMQLCFTPFSLCVCLLWLHNLLDKNRKTCRRRVN